MAEQQMNGEASVIKKYRGEKICRVACYFTTMPDTDDRDIVSDFDGKKYYILDNKTLKIKGEMERIGGWYKERMGSPDAVVITPQLVPVIVPARSGRSSMIFFEYSVNMNTGRSFVMSYLVEERKRVRLIDQIELPIRNKPGNYGCSANLGGDGWYYISFTLDLHDSRGRNTLLSLARVMADHTAKIKCEKLASERLIPGIWLASLVKSGYLWFFTPMQLLKHSFDGKTLEVFKLDPHNGQYPPPWGFPPNILQKRLKQILDRDRATQAAIRNARTLPLAQPPSYTTLASYYPPPPAYEEVEIEEKTNSNVAEEEGTVTRL
uniref:Uncharacterized protein n=1 Tax=Plectus sambesii TaxID=2011161 RepID=A0A914VIS0_9BILA